MYLGLKVLLYNNLKTGQDFAIKIQDAANKAIFENEALLLRAAQGSSFVTKLCGLITIKVSIKKNWLKYSNISLGRISLVESEMMFLKCLETKRYSGKSSFPPLIPC